MLQPKPSYTTFQALLTDIQRGTIKIPQFQREFVWERARSAKLLDSILKGYPLGTFILWKTKERLRAVRNIGNVNLPPPPEGDYVLQVLDGQQRITSLYAALEGIKISDNNDFATICVDLDADPGGADALVLGSVQDLPEGHASIPFKSLRSQTSRALGKMGYTDHQLDRFDTYKQCLETYQFPTVEILDAPLAVATEIFTRLNIGGRSLSVFEIMVAKTWDEEKKFDLSEKVDGLNKELAEVGFGGIDHTILMQAVSALAIGSIKARDILDMDKQSFITTWPLAVVAIKHAVDFCRSDIKIPVRALIPYQRSLIPLAYYFNLVQQNPSGDAKRRIMDLFFRIGLSERYSSAVETKVAQDLKAVKTIVDNKQPTYDFGVDISADYILRNGYFRTGKAFIKTLLCLLAAEKPRCFRSAGDVILDNALLKQKNSRNYHHFFPTAFLKTVAGLKGQPNHIGNITLVGGELNKHKIRDKRPSVYIAEFAKVNSEISNCLATHLIDLTAMGVLEDDYASFLTKRCDKLADKLTGIIIPQTKDTAKQPDLSQNEDAETEGESDAEQDAESVA